MIPTVSPSAQLFLADISNTQSQINTAERQISSGLKISQPSDSPSQMEALMQIRADLDRNTQVTNNLSVVKSETDPAEKALETATQLMDRALTLAAQGANGTETATSRQAMAQEVIGLLQQMVGLSQTQVLGRYVFSGDQASLASYQIDLAAPNGVDRLITPTATRQIVDASGVSFTVAHTAQDIFDHRNPNDSLAPDNVFAALNGLIVSLQNNDQAGITNATNSLHTASDYLNTQLSFYGSVQSRIQDAQTYSSNYQVQLQTNLSHVQDADITQAALQLSQSTTQLNAAMSAEAKIPRSSLFDFLA
jgi:flagellar hook-associated protein 3 FlgL